MALNIKNFETKKFTSDSRQYLNDMSYDVTSDIYSIKLNKLVEEGYLNRVYDYVDNSVCDGYANAIGEGFDYKINTYLMCKIYVKYKMSFFSIFYLFNLICFLRSYLSN